MQNTISFTYQESAGVSYKDLTRLVMSRELGAHTKTMLKGLQQQYATNYASLYLPFDDLLLQQVEQLVKEKKKLHCKTVIVIGIGGSSLGAKAVCQAIKGSLYGLHEQEEKLYFIETVDSDRVTELLTVIEKEFKAGRSVLLNVVTKSGTTLEPIVNFHILLSLLQTYYPKDYQNYVVTITQKDSALWKVSQEQGFSCLTIPEQVGGRYSVFSAVGLFALAMINIDIKQLRAGASSIIATLEENSSMNDPLISAMLSYLHYQKGIIIHDSFLFALDLRATGHWYRQLMGESIGKEYNYHGQQVLEGITPTVSLGSIDLHSVAQLYLGGPRDKFTTFISIEQSKTNAVVKALPALQTYYASLEGKSCQSIMHALMEGTKKAYITNNRPFCSLSLPEINEYYMGQLLQFKMVEMMYLGFLLEVNPFDQPNVELYKQETKKIIQTMQS